MLEEEIKPLEMIDIGIGDVAETPRTDHRSVTVSGTLVNHGTRATREVVVRVEALDKNGVVLLSTHAESDTQTIAPNGTAHFSAILTDRADVDRYHVVAIAR